MNWYVCACASERDPAHENTHTLFDFIFWFNANGNLCVFRMHKLLLCGLLYLVVQIYYHYTLCYGVYGKCVRVCVHIHFMNAFNCILTRTNFYSILFFVRSSSPSFTSRDKKPTIFEDIFGDQRKRKKRLLLSEMVRGLHRECHICAVEKIDECNNEYLKFYSLHLLACSIMFN